MKLLYIIYLIYLEIVPLIAYIYSWFVTDKNYSYIWSELCIKFAGCSITFVKNSHKLSLYEPNGTMFISTKEDLYTTAIDTYITEGNALTITPYNYTTKLLSEYNIYNILSTSKYNNIIVYPEFNNSISKSHNMYINIAWIYKISVQIIMSHNKLYVMDSKNYDANYGTQLCCYISEVIHPKYFNTFDEFYSYIELILECSIQKII